MNGFGGEFPLSLIAVMLLVLFGTLAFWFLFIPRRGFEVRLVSRHKSATSDKEPRE